MTPQNVVLQKRSIACWIDTAALEAHGRRTTVLATAARKRRLYRRFLTWTGDLALCGGHAEEVVHSVLESLRGKQLWLHSTRPGLVRELLGRPITLGGPLDETGERPKNPRFVGEGTVPFAVEVKNVRSILYPYDRDVWDLLAKLGPFPDVVPVLVARRIHFTTFRMFKDLGAYTREHY